MKGEARVMSTDPFATLGIDARFDIDLKAVEKRHRDLARALHPDRYAQSGPSERQEALSRAASVNEAWRVVRDPIRRAEALFALARVPTGETAEPKPSPAFLMDMLEQREELAEAKAARDRSRIEKLAVGVQRRKEAAERALSEAFAGARANPGDGDGAALEAAVPRLGELRFYRRFLEEVSAIEDLLDAAS